jgi:predicted nucleic acid-binding protein
VSREEITCDTSVLLPALVSWHPGHAGARAAVEKRVISVPAHVFLECYSVLTRLPAPHRFAPEVAHEVLAAIDLAAIALPADDQRGLLTELGRHGIRGGSTYDALIAATAKHHGHTLLSADRRARPVYEAIGARVELL